MEEDLTAAMPQMFETILREILKEPAVGKMGSEKRKLIEAIICCNKSGPLSEAFAKPSMKFIFVKTKVMPSAQLEESVKELNALLINEEFYESLLSDSVLYVEYIQDFSIQVVKRLVWRIKSKLMFRFQEFIFHHMKKDNLTAQNCLVMDENERECFKLHLGKTFRSIYRFGLKSGSAVWALRCQCLREMFICSEVSTSSEQFIDQKEWHKDGIVLSAPCLDMCFGLERIMQSLQDNEAAFSSEVVFDNLTNSENLVILDKMRQLSRGILSEDLSIVFLQDIIRSLSALSVKKDALSKLAKASTMQETSVVSLRTNLKRNPTAKVQKPSKESTISEQQDPAKSSNPSLTVGVEQAASSSSKGETSKISQKASQSAARPSQKKASKEESRAVPPPPSTRTSARIEARKEKSN